MQAGFFPASKRGLQVQNLQRALAALQTGQGCLVSLPARLVDELADGHREATLDLLWNVLLHHQVSVSTNCDVIKREDDCVMVCTPSNSSKLGGFILMDIMTLCICCSLNEFLSGMCDVCGAF